LFWCRLAEKVGMPIYLIKQTVPRSEIKLWEAYFNKEYERHEKIEWYFAQIAMEVRRASLVKSGSMRVKDFLLSFVKPKELTPEEAKKRVVGWVLGLSELARLDKKKTK